MRAGTLVHSFGSMYLSPMIPIYLRNGKGNGGKFLREVGKDEMLKVVLRIADCDICDNCDM